MTSPSPTIGFLYLRDLVALRQVGIEIVLAVENRAQVDLGFEPEAGANGLRDAFLVDDRQHARHRRIDERDVIIGLAAVFRARAGKKLGATRHLGVDLQADHELPVARRAADEL